MQPKISIIIPVKNGISTIEACLSEIFKQTLISDTEVIIIDSGSTDSTLEIVKKYPIILHQIPPEEFGHGKTRNLGVSIAKGEFVVMTVQDARPSSDTWLETMLQHFEDSEVAGVCGQQVVPHEKNKNPVEWFRPVSKPGFNVKHFPSGTFSELSNYEQWKNCRWDDVNAMYRKSVLEKIQFADVAFGEDMIWARDALKAGQKIVYDSRSQVCHYHHYTKKSAIAARLTQTYHFTYLTFNYLRPNPFTWHYILKNQYLCLRYKTKPYWWFYNFKLNWISRQTVKNFVKTQKQLSLKD